MEASEAAAFAEQQAIAEMEKKKRDWETARRLLERSPSPMEPELNNDDLLTFSREDSINQVSNSPVNTSSKPNVHSLNSSLSTKNSLRTKNTRVKSKYNKSLVINSSKQSSAANDSSSDDSSDSSSSRSESNESSDSDNDSNFSNDSNTPNFKVNRISLDSSKDNSKSPRTRSRGTVKIDLWTLDVNPLIPSTKSTNKMLQKLKRSDTTEINNKNSIKIRRKITNPNLSSESVKHNSENILQDYEKCSTMDSSIHERDQNTDDKENPLSNDDTWTADFKKSGRENDKDLSKSKVDSTLSKRISRSNKAPMKHVNITSKNKTLDSWLATNKVKVGSNSAVVLNQPVVSLTSLPFQNPNLIIRTRRASCNTDKEHIVHKKLAKRIIQNKSGKTNESVNEI